MNYTENEKLYSKQAGAWGDEANGEDGDTICLRIAHFDYSRFRFKETPSEELTVRHYSRDVIERLRLKKGDILIEKSGGGEKTPVGRTVVFDKDYTALYANFMDCLRCTSTVHPQFMQYVFVTFYKNDYSRNYIKQTTGKKVKKRYEYERLRTTFSRIYGWSEEAVCDPRLPA